MRYACLIYYDPKKLFGGSPEANAALSECANYDEVLKESGHFVTAEALELPESAMTAQVRDGKMSAVDGPFMETKEMLGGIIIIEAPDLNEAARLAAGHPLARIGAVEVRPVVDFSTPPPQL
ncbi:YciI family protein [Nitratireductor luteus]|uniref:YciI family protein n=1 Tax=Nitratireductor luteus TaxID=2976980 RepID=UPI00223F7B76|nr:YciI family protein [Nitratireductor luteus]